MKVLAALVAAFGIVAFASAATAGPCTWSADKQETPTVGS